MDNILSFVVPIKDENENVKVLLSKLKEVVFYEYSVVLVYDEENSAIKNLKEEVNYSNVIFLKNKYDKGFSNAIKTGIENIKTKYFIVTMADNSDDVKLSNDMVKMAEDENFDVVVPSRYTKGGKYIGGNLLKKMISNLAGLSLFFLKKIPVVDVTNNFKLFRTDKVKELKIESDMSFDIGMELTVKICINHGKIKEIPTCWTDRVVGKSKFSLAKHVIPYLKWYYLALRLG